MVITHKNCFRSCVILVDERCTVQTALFELYPSYKIEPESAVVTRSQYVVNLLVVSRVFDSKSWNMINGHDLFTNLPSISLSHISPYQHNVQNFLTQT